MTKRVCRGERGVLNVEHGTGRAAVRAAQDRPLTVLPVAPR